MKEIVMPHMGVVVETGKIIKWLVKEGDFVKEGESLFDVETEKVNITIDSKYTGTILKIIHKEGDVVPVGGTVAMIGKKEEVDNFTLKKESDIPVNSKSEPVVKTYEVVPLNNIKKITAQKMEESWRSIPQFSIFSKIIVNNFISYKNSFSNKYPKITYSDIFIKLVGETLQEHPYLNASFLIEENNVSIKVFKVINVGLAVDTPQGLIVVTFKNVTKRSINEIINERIKLIEKAKSNSLSLEEVSEATFTISNLGMFKSVDKFTALINPPQSAILAIGKIKEEINLKYNYLWLTLSSDHRVVDGASAARFMDSLKKKIEEISIDKYGIGLKEK
jgi:pyruvate dehydrogenase E2 component (dihydrolipoamide acetyltransferase)